MKLSKIISLAITDIPQNITYIEGMALLFS